MWGNHHKSTIIFTANFISKENIESFEWLFKGVQKLYGLSIDDHHYGSRPHHEGCPSYIF